MESSLAISYKGKPMSTIQPPPRGYPHPKRGNMHSHKLLYANVYGRFVYSLRISYNPNIHHLVSHKLWYIHRVDFLFSATNKNELLTDAAACS